MNIATNTNIVIAFSELVDEAALTDGIEIRQGSTQVGFKFSFSAETRMLTITPSTSLSNDNVYTVSLKGSIQSTAKGKFNPITWSFSTIAAGKGLPRPNVVAKLPLYAETEVAVYNNIYAVFDVPMDPATFNASSIELKQGATIAECNYSYNADTRCLTISPKQNLAFSSDYSLTLKPGIKSVARISLPETKWSFKTFASDSYIPRIVSRIPEENQQLDIKADLIIGFNVSMDTTTLTSSTVQLKQEDNIIPCKIYYTNGSHNLIIHPVNKLAEGNIYTISFKAGITTINNVPLPETTWFFTTSTRPKIISISPADGSYDNPINGDILIKFDKAMNATSLFDFVGISLTDYYANEVKADIRRTYSEETNTLIINISNAQSAHIRRIYVNEHVRAKDNTYLDTDGSPYPFTSINFEHYTLPVGVVSRSPHAWMLGGASITSNIFIQFEKELDQKTILPENIELAAFPLNAGYYYKVPLSFSYSETTRTLTIIPLRPLEHLAQYTVSFKSNGLKFMDNTFYMEGWSWRTN